MPAGLRRAVVADGELRLELENTLEAVEAGRGPLVDYARDRSVGAKALNRLEVVFEELVSNVIRHGFRRDASQSLVVRARASGAGVELIVEDDGAPFNLLERPAPASPASIAEATLGGLGIPLVLRLSAAVRYERPEPTTGGGFRPNNRVILTLAP
jgi:anti-sigma regulatory factor (Ser/Thr protein kinase)